MNDKLSFEEESFSRSPAVDCLCLFVFATFLSLWGLAAGPGLGDHEAIVAQAARETRQNGNWLIPTLCGEPRVRKAPLAIWAASISSAFSDPSNVDPPVSPLAARLPSALASILTTILVYAMGRSMFGHRSGLIGATVMACCAGTLFFSHNAQVEMLLTFLVTASFAFFWFGTEGGNYRAVYLALFYAAFALAMLAKAPLPAVTIGLPLAVWWFVILPLTKPQTQGADGPEKATFTARVMAQVRALPKLWLIPGVVLFLLIFLPWPLYVLFKVDGVLDLWNMEYLGRYSGDLSLKTRPFWYYLPILLALMLPFSLSLPEAVASPFLSAYRQHRQGLLFALTWAFWQVLFLSTAAFKRPHYVAACIPALALLLGPTLERLFLSARTFSRPLMRAAIGAILLTLVVGLGVGGYFVAQQSPELLGAAGVAGPILVIGIVVSCIAFATRQRVLSFVSLVVTVGLVFASSWVMLGQSRALQAKAFTMVEEIKAAGISTQDPITWVVGRPDTRLIYYLERPIKPLFTPLEVATRRDARSVVPQTLLLEGADRIRDRLASDQKEYFIIHGKYWERLLETIEVPPRKIARVPGKSGTGKDWILFTNEWNTE